MAVAARLHQSLAPGVEFEFKRGEPLLPQPAAHLLDGEGARTPRCCCPSDHHEVGNPVTREREILPRNFARAAVAFHVGALKGPQKIGLSAFPRRSEREVLSRIRAFESCEVE